MLEDYLVSRALVLQFYANNLIPCLLATLFLMIFVHYVLLSKPDWKATLFATIMFVLHFPELWLLSIGLTTIGCTLFVFSFFWNLAVAFQH